MKSHPRFLSRQMPGSRRITILSSELLSPGLHELELEIRPDLVASRICVRAQLEPERMTVRGDGEWWYCVERACLVPHVLSVHIAEK